MNVPDRPDMPVRPGGPFDVHEWDAQESAISAERRSADPAGHDERVAQYRLIARALRHPPLDPVPYEFAAELAARVGAPPRSADERLERLLLRGLLTVLVASGTVVTALYGASWAQAAIALLPDGAMVPVGTVGNWAVALLACVALSWALERVCRRIVE
jgi:hypothetical protein